MAKRCPSCGYGPIGPFSDNCPICAEPVRNVRSGGYGSGAWSPTLKGVLLGVLICTLLVAGCCGVGLWRMGGAMRDMQADWRKQVEEARAQVEADRKARTVVVNAADLVKEFQADAEAAGRKYQGKYLELTGVVERVGKQHDTIPFVIVNGGDENAKVKVECYFETADRRYQARLNGLKKGDPITVRGEFTGQVSNAQVRMCEFPDLPPPIDWGGEEE
jgi:hypothetical protein